MLGISITEGMAPDASITDGVFSGRRTFLTECLPGLAVIRASFSSCWGHLGVEVILALLVLGPSLVGGD